MMADDFERWNERLKIINEAIEAGYLNISEWEAGFIESIEKWLTDKKPLTWKQSKALNRIFEKIE
jgi:hypothetical protein